MTRHGGPLVERTVDRAAGGAPADRHSGGCARTRLHAVDAEIYVPAIKRLLNPALYPMTRYFVGSGQGKVLKKWVE
jgi:hypothetical protein